MPIGEAHARHLLRRTEFVDRQSRVDAIKNLTIGQAVDDVLAGADGSAGQLDVGSGNVREQGERTITNWLDRMAGVGGNPFRERMAFFWHGHLCSELGKVNSAPFMAEQIDLFRSDGVNGTVGQLLKDMAVQVAMLRYLDGDRNVSSSPNQNFARELMELFVLGVGNYSEDDVEAATDAWTGFTVRYDAPGGDSDAVRSFIQETHSRGVRTYMGRTINDIRFQYVGFSTIDVLLWLNTTYSSGAGGSTSYAGVGGVTPNGTATKQVAAKFLSKKLWQEFGEAASGTVPAGVEASMVTALLDNDFAIKPWVRAMLTHPDFYASETMTGLVRQPVEYLVGLLVAGGQRATVEQQTFLNQAGQVPLYPPNVSGWKPNGYWINASALEGRNSLAETVAENLTATLPSGYVQLPGGRVTTSDLTGSPSALVDRVLAFMDLGPLGPGRQLTEATRSSLIAYCNGATGVEERSKVILLALLAPEMHVA